MAKNNLEELTVSSIKWVKSHYQVVATIIGTIIIFGLLAVYFIHQYITVRKQLWDRISIAQGYASHGMTNQSIQILDDIISKYPKSEIVQYALITKADISYQTKNYNLSAQLYRQVIDNKKPKHLIPFAYAGLGASKENLGDFQNAISIYNEFINNFTEHYLVLRIYDSLARTYLLSGSPDLAQQTYQKIVTLYPGTYWSNQIQKDFSIRREKNDKNLH